MSNPSHTFPRKFPIDGEAADLLQTCCGVVSDTANESTVSLLQVVVIDGETANLFRTVRNSLVTDLLRTC